METTECHYVAVRALETLFNNRDKNILKLHSQREDLYKQLKINRDLIDKALNEFGFVCLVLVSTGINKFEYGMATKWCMTL
jgi:hypothetical protein